MNFILTYDILMGSFKGYNPAIQPMQIIAYILGAIALFLTLKRYKYSDRIISLILSFMWFWSGIGFLLLAMAPDYTPAYLFALLFIIQGSIFLINAFKPQLSFSYKTNSLFFLGLVFIAYATIGYPVLGYFLKHVYPQTPPFGLTPCPVVIFTFGLSLIADTEITKKFFLIPFLWGIAGILPVSVGFLEDIGLITAGFLGVAMILKRNKGIRPIIGAAIKEKSTGTKAEGANQAG